MKKVLSLCLSVMILLAVSPAALGASPILGSRSGDIYTNSYFGFGCKFTGYKYKSESELASENGISTSLMRPSSVSDLTARLNSGQALYVLEADANDNRSQVFIRVRYCFGLDLGFMSMDSLMDVLHDKILAEIKELKGVKDPYVTKMGINFQGKQRDGFKVTFSMRSVPIFQKIVLIPKGDLIFEIMVRTYQTNKVDELLGKFYKT